MESVSESDYVFYYVLAVTLLLVLILYALTRNVYRKFPPGPWGLPIVGYLPFVGRQAHVKFMKLAEQYGNVFQVYFGSTRIVVLNGSDTVREALTGSMGAEFASRPDFFVNRLIKRKGTSIAIGKYSSDFKIRRKILITALSKFANSKQKSFHTTLDEATREMVSNLKSHEGQLYNPKKDIAHSLGKIISSLCFGKEFLQFEDQYHFIMDNIQTVTDMISMSGILTFLPWTRIFFKKKIAKFMELDNTLNAMCTNLINPHKESFDEENVRDIADAIFKTTQEMASKGEQTVTIIHDDIIRMVRELLLAGFVTVATTLLFGLYYMVAFPDVQKKVQQEIDTVISDNRFPTANDKSKLPYTDATVLEILRFTSLAPFGIPRAATKDFVFQGYFIPENTVIFPNLWSVHRDPTIWKKPEEFNPLQFLSSDEKEVRYDYAEKIMSFGAGRRRCPGEILARLELFVMFSTLLQQFEFSNDPDDKINLKLYEPLGKLNSNCQNIIIKCRKSKNIS